MGEYSKGYLKVSGLFLSVSAVAVVLLYLVSVIFPGVSAPSSIYDCDDSALSMYRHFEQYGIEAVPVIGNLDASGESYNDCDHVWLLVKLGDMNIAYDWGMPYFDAQHYEGYEISLDYLLFAVAEDSIGSSTLVAANN